MKEFIQQILEEEYRADYQHYFDNSHLISYLDSKMGAVNGNAKSRRSLANIYAIYSILKFYVNDFYNDTEKYKKFTGYEYTKLFNFYRSLYGGEKLQNHALNSRVNGEFGNKFPDIEKNLIIIDNGRYALHIDFLYVNGVDMSKTVIRIIECYISILQEKDSSLISDIAELLKQTNVEKKKEKIKLLIDDKSEARIFEIISFAILKHHYKSVSVYIGFDIEHLEREFLTLYKTGRTNANDGGIDFVMRPLGRFYQVTEVDNYNKYTLDMDKVMHFPITFVIKTLKNKELVENELKEFIELKSGGMEVIKKRYQDAIEEIITINELKEWLDCLDNSFIDELLKDIDLYYRLELNLEILL